ncbi:hypothetical protein CRG98_042557, partial [Punica granatum]
MCCTLVWVMQRLPQYTLYHTLRLLSKTDPLKYVFSSPSSMRNIAKWHCQLTEYDIEYVSHTSVKGQVIADHLAEFPIDDDTLINSNFPNEGILQVSDEEETPGWKMYFDGAVSSTGSGTVTCAKSTQIRLEHRPTRYIQWQLHGPFQCGSTDVIGPINPKAYNGHLFILVSIDYFTKWIEATTLASFTAKVVARFLKHDIIARYE